jgi:hypothetical protein
MKMRILPTLGDAMGIPAFEAEPITELLGKKNPFFS